MLQLEMQPQNVEVNCFIMDLILRILDILID